MRALDRPLGYQIFNLGNGSPYRLCDFIALVEANVGKKALIKVLPDQPGDVPRTCANIEKARELLGYEPTVTFEEGIRRTVAWYNEWMATKAKAAEKKAAAAGGAGVVPAAGEGGSATSSASSTGSSDPAVPSEGSKVRQPGSRVRRVASAVSVFSTGGLSG